MTILLVGVFVLQLIIHVINSVGVTAVNEILWIMYNKIPTPYASAERNVAAQKREVLRLKKEMNAVSAQDDFARWAKLRRYHDKATAEYDKTAASIKAARGQFDMVVSTARWLGTTGLRFLLQFWCAKTAIYWLPTGWLPYYVEWILSFPKAPLGSISIQSWWIACTCVIQLVSDTAMAAWTLAEERRDMQKEAGQKKEKMAFGSDSNKIQAGSVHEKVL